MKYFHLICHKTLKIRSQADFKTADNSVFQYSNAIDMRVTQDLTYFGEIIAHAQCSVDGMLS
jgi:hypothetical protein